MDECAADVFDVRAAVEAGAVSRRHNLRRLRSNWYYKAQELARDLKVSLGTVRKWTMQGLAPVSETWPYLYHGEEVKAFLTARAKPRQPLGPGELYCTPCKKPRRPRGNRVIIKARSATAVTFNGACSDCGRPMFRPVRISEIEHKLGGCRVSYEDGQTTVCGNRHPVQLTLFDDLAA